MPLTDFAKDRLDALEHRAIAAVKAEYAGRIARVREAVSPPLTTRELSVGLGLQDAERRGASVVGRFLSTSARNRRARPDTRVRALLDALCAGELFLCVRGGPLGGPRTVLIAAERDVRWLDRGFEVINLAGHPVPERRARRETWDDEAIFDLFEERPRDDTPPPTRHLVGFELPAVGLGTLRLSTGEDRPERARARATLEAALDAGIRLFDVADSYGLDSEDLHHAERLVAEVLGDWDGPRDQVLVVTKAGLARPGGRWIPKGDPSHLRDTVLRSRDALDVEVLPLVLLHAVDPRVPVEQSLGALHALREEGVVWAVGICNTDVQGLAAARRVGPVAALQVELSLLSTRALPVLLAAREAGIPVMAHRPLGGWKRAGRLAQDPVLQRVAEEQHQSPQAAALAWLISLSPGLIPLVGATRPQTARDSAHAARFTLPEQALQRLDARIDGLPEAREALRRSDPGPEVVLLMGPPAAGKTSAVSDYTERGYLRLNRDERGGRLDDLLAPLDQALRNGVRHVVLDNTYPTRASRRGVIETARRHGLPARAVWIDTPERDALRNACERLLDRAGELLDPAALSAHPDPNLLPAAAVHAWFTRLEPPTTEEGLAEVERVPFVRRVRAEATRPALLLDLDGTVRRATGGAPFPRHAGEVALLPGRRERLLPFVEAGVKLCGVTNQGGVGLRQLTESAMWDAVERTVELLDLPMDVRACPHHPRAGCWCRKPLPGMGVALMREHGLDASRTWVIGDRDSDAAFAEALGLPFFHADAFFAARGPSVQALIGSDPLDDSASSGHADPREDA